MDETWFRDAKPTKLGKFGERVWANVLVNSGYGVVQLAEATEYGAAVIHGKNMILPDIEAYGQRRIYIDSKAKKHPVYYRNGYQWRHGINKRNYEHYRDIAGTQLQGFALGVLECFRDESNSEWSGSLLFGPFTHIGKPIGGSGEPVPKVYWPRDRFVCLAMLSPCEMWDCSRSRQSCPSVKSALDELLIERKRVQRRMF